MKKLHIAWSCLELRYLARTLKVRIYWILLLLFLKSACFSEIKGSRSAFKWFNTTMINIVPFAYVIHKWESTIADAFSKITFLWQCNNNWLIFINKPKLYCIHSCYFQVMVAIFLPDTFIYLSVFIVSVCFLNKS